MHISLGTNNDGSPLSDYVSFFLGDDSVLAKTHWRYSLRSPTRPGGIRLPSSSAI